MLNMLEMGKDRRKKQQGSVHRDRLFSIPIDCITSNPNQPRRLFDQESISELAESIKQYGLIQPITVRQISDLEYELIAGERRLRACIMAGITVIKAIVITASESDSALIAMIENLQREDLNYFDEAIAYKRILHDHGYTQEELAKQLGKNQSTIANKIRLLRLSDEVKQFALDHGLSERHSRALLRLVDEKEQLRVAKLAVDNSLSVKQTEGIVEQRADKIANSSPSNKVRLLHRDYRMFINTIKNTVSQLNSQGLHAQVSTHDIGDAVEIRVLVSKDMQREKVVGRRF